jgi:uncharacterized metal-binding protein
MRKDVTSVQITLFRRIKTSMKKLLAMALGMGLVLGTVSFSFAQDTTSTTGKKMSKKKKKSDSTDTTKK